MKPAPFDYFAPTTVDEVHDLLNQYGDDAKILTGGQSLIPVMAHRLSQPSTVIDVNHLRELDDIRDDAYGLAIGAITCHRTAGRSPPPALAISNHPPLSTPALRIASMVPPTLYARL